MMATRDASDTLSDLMTRMRWSVTNVESSRFTTGESRHYRGSAISFHHVASGELELRTSDVTTTLHAGDVVLLPQRGDHHLSAVGPATLLSGSMTLAADHAVLLAHQLPALIVACCLAIREPLMAELLAGISAENETPRLGATSVMNSLANVVAAAVIRAWIEGDCGANAESWLVSLHDPQVGLALDAIHDDPGAPWTVDRLARVAMASRSAFAARFTGMVGESPARYLARFRMTRAMEQLRQGVGIASVATSLGYGSDVAFSRAFRRHVGASPAAWRQQRS